MIAKTTVRTTVKVTLNPLPHQKPTNGWISSQYEKSPVGSPPEMLRENIEWSSCSILDHIRRARERDLGRHSRDCEKRTPLGRGVVFGLFKY